MKKYIAFVLFITSLFLYSCSGSDVYRGAWKATDPRGEKFSIGFEAKSFSVKDKDGKTISYNYTQNSVSIENSVRTYGIQLSDGRRYLIDFPFAGDVEKGVMKDPDGNVLYIIGRKDYITYDELNKLK